MKTRFLKFSFLFIATAAVSFGGAPLANEKSTRPLPASVQPNGGTVFSVSCPADISQPSDSGNSGATVSYDAPVVTGGFGVVNVVCNPPSGSLFPVGQTQVTCTATDQNEAQTSCSFFVTVTANSAQDEIQGCINEVLEFGAAVPVGELREAIKALNKDKPNSMTKACKELEEFIQQTRKLARKGNLNEETAGSLINCAMNVQESIGCFGQPEN